MRTADAFVASEYMLIKLNTPAHRVFGFPSSCERGFETIGKPDKELILVTGGAFA
jgi:hypothetical protein